jgi:hypothetical protein
MVLWHLSTTTTTTTSTPIKGALATSEETVQTWGRSAGR